VKIWMDHKAELKIDISLQRGSFSVVSSQKVDQRIPPFKACARRVGGKGGVVF